MILSLLCMDLFDAYSFAISLSLVLFAFIFFLFDTVWGYMDVDTTIMKSLIMIKINPVLSIFTKTFELIFTHKDKRYAKTTQKAISN